MTGYQNIQKVVERAYRSVRLSRTVRTVMMVLLIYSLLVLFSTSQTDSAGGANVMLIAVCVAWLVLSIKAKRKAGAATMASQLIAAGQIDHAQEILADVCRGLCIHKPVQLLACHNLALTCQKQGHWLQAWQLCELVRNSARNKYNEIVILSEGLRAQCSLTMNNLPAAHESLSVLSGMKLSISERLSVLQAETIYSIRVGRSDAVMADLVNKVSLAGLLPSDQAGEIYAWLALAASFSKQAARRDWLWRKATLYCPEEELLSRNQAFSQVGQNVRTARIQACKKKSV